jgi:hypothetical protein
MFRLVRAALVFGVAVMATAQPVAAQVPGDGLPSDGPEVFIAAALPGAYGSPLQTVDRLDERSVLRMTVVGFEPESTGVIEQCSVGGCSNPFPVAFDIDGRARFQYLVRDDFARTFETASSCRVGQPACVVHIRSGDRQAFLNTVFRDPAPRSPAIRIEPNRFDLVDGARLRISVTGFAPGSRLQAMFCVAPHTYRRAGCGAPGPVSSFTIGADGVGRTTLPVREGRVGSGGASCGGSSQCTVVVKHAGTAVPEAFTSVEFSEGPSAQYDVTRSLAGLSIAAILLGLAFLLMRGTDWRKPTEADTPDLDRVTFNDDE